MRATAKIYCTIGHLLEDGYSEETFLYTPVSNHCSYWTKVLEKGGKFEIRTKVYDSVDEVLKDVIEKRCQLQAEEQYDVNAFKNQTHKYRTEVEVFDQTAPISICKFEF